MRKNIFIFLLLAGSVFLFAPISRAMASPFLSGYSCTKSGVCQDSSSSVKDTAETNCKNICGGFFSISCTFSSSPCPPRDFCCTGKGGEQYSLKVDSLFETAGGKCDAQCDTSIKPCTVSPGVCPPLTDRHCIVSKSSVETYCEDMPQAADAKYVQDACQKVCKARAQGEICRVITGNCANSGKTAKYGCARDGECIDIPEIDSKAAEAECLNWCKTPRYKVCKFYDSGFACPSGPLANTSAKDLIQQAQALNKLKITGIPQLISRFINILMAFIGSIALVLYIYSGFLWMTASGNTEQTGKAKTTMVWTTLGVAMMLASYMLASFIFKSLGV